MARKIIYDCGGSGSGTAGVQSTKAYQIVRELTQNYRNRAI